jgi:hypothetical protein
MVCAGSGTIRDLHRGQQRQHFAAAPGDKRPGRQQRSAHLTIQEEAITESQRRLPQKSPLPCTTSRSCMPFPEGIDAPRIFEIYNDAVMYNDYSSAMPFTATRV